MKQFEKYASLVRKMEEKEASYYAERNAIQDELYDIESSIGDWAKKQLKDRIDNSSPVLIKTDDMLIAFSYNWMKKPIIILPNRVVDLTKTNQENATD